VTGGRAVVEKLRSFYLTLDPPNFVHDHGVSKVLIIYPLQSAIIIFSNSMAYEVGSGSNHCSYLPSPVIQQVFCKVNVLPLSSSLSTLTSPPRTSVASFFVR